MLCTLIMSKSDYMQRIREKNYLLNAVIINNEFTNFLEMMSKLAIKIKIDRTKSYTDTVLFSCIKLIKKILPRRKANALYCTNGIKITNNMFLTIKKMVWTLTVLFCGL